VKIADTTRVTRIDIVVIVWVGLSAVVGFRRGLVGQALALGGFALGALIGSRIGPHALSAGARESWQPVAALAGAIIGGLIAQIATAQLADMLRRRFLRGPLATLDGAGGLVVGGALGLAVAWLLAVTALHQPSLGLRGDVQRSSILPRLVRWLPAQSLLDAIARLDQLPVLPVGGVRSLPPPDASLEVAPAVRRAEQSVVLVEGTSCGLTLQGSGWVVRPGLVATNAHVLSGEHDTRVLLGDHSLTATPVYVSASTDVALLRVRGLDAPALPVLTNPHSGARVALLGYPGGGPFRAAAGTIGTRAQVWTPDAYGRGHAFRMVVPIRGTVLHGDSGGPAVDRTGHVVAMMFAAADGGGGGYGVPVADVLRGIGAQRASADTGPCVQ
jgi:S1-C subfamily serine protease